MINEINKFLTVSWLSGLLSAEIFISTGEWGVQMPPLTSENSHFLRSGPQEAILVIKLKSNVFHANCFLITGRPEASGLPVIRKQLAWKTFDFSFIDV